MGNPEVTEQRSAFTMFLGMPRCAIRRPPSLVKQSYACDCGFNGDAVAYAAHFYETSHAVSGDALASASRRLRLLGREAEALRSRLAGIANEETELSRLLALQTVPKRNALRPCSKCGQLTREMLGTRPFCASHVNDNPTAITGKRTINLYADLMSDDDA